MKFCDKLSKLRKTNNFSQEQLADKLGLSRQAISKWELGSSYPDMEKMIQMCNLFNCTLEDLMDDGVIKENKENNSKQNFNKYFNDMLKFITDSYNMLCAMKWKERLKCIFEMVFMGLLLLLAGTIIFEIASSLTSNLFKAIPFEIGNYFCILFDTIYLLILFIMCIIIFIHLYKIRYLDYYITIEDKSIKEKIIEEPIEKIENKNYISEKKEKVIIRDPKHSSFSILSALGKTILWFIKALTLFITIPAIICFLALVILLVISICHYPYGIVFIYIAIVLAGILVLNYIFTELLYDFIVGHKPSIARVFIIIFAGLITCGIGSGLTANEVMNFSYKEAPMELTYKTDIKEITLFDDSIFHGILSPYYTNYKVDNTLKDVAKVEIKYVEDIGYDLYPIDETHEYYLYLKNSSFWDFYKYVLKDIKNKIIRDYDYDSFIQVQVYASEDNIKKIKSNIDHQYDNYNYTDEENY